MRNNLHVLLRAFIIALLLVGSTSLLLAQTDDIQPAEIENDEGGPVIIEGQMSVSNLLLFNGIAEPLILLEDEGGFVRRDQTFTFPPESQVLGQFTSDFFSPPVSFTFSLPIEPQATLSDVDQDSEEDTGVMIYAVAFWTNAFGDPFLEKRDQGGGGWSGDYASMRVESATGEVYGGKYLVYAPDDQQGFPSGFGDDGLLFTEDDPIVLLPQGYTVVDMDTDTFTFDRSRIAHIDTIESPGAAADDFSNLSYTEAFDAMVDKFRREYAFTEFKGLDWDALSAEFRPRIEQAEADNDAEAFQLAVQEFSYQIPDGHVNVSSPYLNSLPLSDDIAGGLGIAIIELTDGRIIVNFLLDGSPADEAGIEMGAEILDIDGERIDDVISSQVGLNPPYSSDIARRLDQVRDAVRFPVGEDVEVTYQNPGDSEPTSVTMTTIDESDSRIFSRTTVYGEPRTDPMPVAFDFLDSGYGYVQVFSFFENEVLTVQTFELFLDLANQQGIPGIIIDLRRNGGGSGSLADGLAGYFLDEPIPSGYTGFYSEEAQGFIIDPNTITNLYPAPENKRYHGEVVVLVGPSCASACEFFAYDLTLTGHATVVSQYPSAGLGGSVNDFLMPEAIQVRITIGRNVDPEGNIHIEGTGVVPDVLVPVDEETAFSEGDPVLDAAVAYLDDSLSAEITDGGQIAVGDTVTGDLTPGARVQYSLDVSEGSNISIFLTDETGELDTVLRLYDTDGNLLVENDDAESGDTVNSALEELDIPADLTVIVEVATYQDASEGSYTLKVVQNS